MINLLDLELNKMEDFVVGLGQPKFRAKQVFGWIYKGVTDFDGMTNVPAALRQKLAEESVIALPEILLQRDCSSKNSFKSVLYRYRIYIGADLGCRCYCRSCSS